MLKPREKLRVIGTQSMSLSELLAVVLGSGSVKEDVISLSKRIISDYGNSIIFEQDLNVLKKNLRITELKAMQIISIVEIGKRLFRPIAENRRYLGNAKLVVSALGSEFELAQEQVKGIFLDQQQQVLLVKLLALGGENYVNIEAKIILKPAIEIGATGLILVHNHPSGNTQPSEADVQVTKRINAACELLGVKLVDHVIIGDGYFSFFEHKLL